MAVEVRLALEEKNGNCLPHRKARCLQELLEKNCYDIVLAKEKAPNKSDPGFSQKDYNEYISRKRLALSLIYLNINPEYRKIIENLDDPIEVWSTLNLNFQPDNRSYHLLLFNQLVKCAASHSLSSLLNYLRAFGDGPVAGVPGGQGIESWLACLEFEPSATKDPPAEDVGLSELIYGTKKTRANNPRKNIALNTEKNAVFTAERYSVFAEEAIQFTVNGRDILMEGKKEEKCESLIPT
ncbi:hypothetical protein TNCV_3699091 [Trichonephila clavipes]|uniref:Uncharacterized protein n=1 Tax=Trichonephila clavipes TaxID=2585209 RepID=A0A8X6S9L3_TRICX|nr:hypothetical protein TNCV_3699091 [Trichonephila clavipes]